MLKLKKKIIFISLICLDCIFVFFMLVKEKNTTTNSTKLNAMSSLALKEEFSEVSSEANYIMETNTITQDDIIESQKIIVNEQQEKFAYHNLIVNTEFYLSQSVKKYIDLSKKKVKKIIPPKVTGDINSVNGKDIAKFSLQFDGNPYVMGGTSLTTGADCSGFVQSLYKAFGINIPRGATSQSLVGTEVSLKDIKEGDLVFYSHGKNPIDHVALYIGNGKIIHAQTPKEGIGIDPVKCMKIVKIKRILNN